MSIQVVCPNGHSLQVKESSAGKTGLCPVCKARIEVPQPAREELSEDVILGILGTGVPGRPQTPLSADGAGVKVGSAYERPAPPKKSCDKCNREIDAATHICPYCHTYIAVLKDF